MITGGSSIIEIPEAKSYVRSDVEVVVALYVTLIVLKSSGQVISKVNESVMRVISDGYFTDSTL